MIDFPSGVPIVRADLEMDHPGQMVLRSIYGAGPAPGEDGAGGGWTPDFGGPWTIDWEEAV